MQSLVPDALSDLLNIQRIATTVRPSVVDGVRDDALRALVVPGLMAGVFDKIEGATVDID